MELNIGDLVVHKVHGDIIGYGMVISPSARLYRGKPSTIVCSVQWVESGRIHTIDVDMLVKIAPDKKCPTQTQNTVIY